MTPLSLEELTAVGAHRRGHFVLSSGLHSGDYLQCALYLMDPRRAERAGRLLAEAVRTTGVEPGLVVSPALGGVIVGHETARALGTQFVFTERKDGAMQLRRGFGIPPGTQVLVVEDVVTTGRSTREVMAVVEARGGRIAAVAAMVNRSGGPRPFGPLPFVALLEAALPTWPADACPLCARGLPVERPGSRPGA